MNIKLNDCLRCGNVKPKIITEIDPITMFNEYYVICPNCGAKTEYNYFELKHAVNEWNENNEVE